MSSVHTRLSIQKSEDESNTTKFRKDGGRTGPTDALCQPHGAGRRFYSFLLLLAVRDNWLTTTPFNASNRALCDGVVLIFVGAGIPMHNASFSGAHSPWCTRAPRPLRRPHAARHVLHHAAGLKL